MTDALTTLKRRLADVHNLGRAEAVLDWDQQTQMPPGGVGAREEQKATLTRQMAARAREAGKAAMADRIEEQADLDEKSIRIIRETLLETMPNPTSQLIEIERALVSGEGRPEG